jgi:hypothetical protein
MGTARGKNGIEPVPRWLRAAVLAGVLGVFLLTGCVRRRIVVNSNPPGARVYFDGEYKGTTPVDFRFKWYGGHRLRLEREGYDDSVQIVEIRAPLHLKVPFDFFSELAPFPVEDRKEFQVELVNQSENKTGAKEPAEPH